MTPRPPRLLLFTTTLVASLASCEIASAQWVAAVDSGITEERHSDTPGAAVDGRFGLRFGLPREFIIHTIICQPELVGGYRSMPWSRTHLWRLGAGARIGLVVLGLQTFAFAHTTAADREGDWGLLGDVGAALDYPLSPWTFGYDYAREFVRVSGLKQQIDHFGLHISVRGYWF